MRSLTTPAYPILLSALLMLNGCKTLTPPSPVAPIPEESLHECQPLTRLRSGSHNDVEAWALDTIFAYQDCRDAHAELIQAVRNRQDAK